MLIVWGSFKKTSNLALNNLFHESVLTRFISEKIGSTFVFVKVTIDIISNIGRMFLHSSLMVSLVNTLDQILRYFTHLLFFTSGSIWVFKLSIRVWCCQLHKCFWIIILEMRWYFFHSLITKVTAIFIYWPRFCACKTSIFLKMGDSWIPAKCFSIPEQILDTVSF